jgi:hypothetical protein
MELRGSSSQLADEQHAVVATASSDGYRQIAPLWHTGLVLLAQGFLSYRGFVRVGALHAGGGGRIQIYERTMMTEWLMFGLVLAGVWWHRASLETVLGRRWSSLTQFMRDLGIGLLFLILVVVMGSMLSHGDDSATRSILPQGSREMFLWLGLSLTAGICEEALFRGYLQRQFISVTRSVPAGVVLSGIAFGGAHVYQGWRMAVQIGVLGGIGGVIAYWCRSVRPGMIEHFLQDVLGGLMRH